MELDATEPRHLLLAIGNSRLHWGLWHSGHLSTSWNTLHLTTPQIRHLLTSHFDFSTLGKQQPRDFPSTLPALSLPPEIPLTIASVVPSQTMLWRQVPNAEVLTLADIPLHGLYPSLGIDRALALLGAAETIGTPVLVVDGGTALTFTGLSSDRHLVGGAILPGLALQYRALTLATEIPATASTATQPLEWSPTYSRHYQQRHYQQHGVDLGQGWLRADNSTPIDRWACNTPDAIRSGVLHTLRAGIESFIQDWWQQFPQSAIVLTGGDSATVLAGLAHSRPTWVHRLHLIPDLVLQGIRIVVSTKRNKKN